MTSGQPLHALAWLAWALAAAACVELAPSPPYVALVVAVAFLVVSVHGVGTPLARSFPLLLGVGAAFGAVRVLLIVATTHGGRDVLFTTPHVDLPSLLGGFRVGGTVELPVLLQAATESFAVVGVMAAFGAFNAVVSHHELVRSAPRAFYELGLVVTVAVAFVPSTVATIQRVREADLARTGGRKVRRGRLLRVTVPVLESALERAMALAESMDSRGFAHLPPSGADRAVAWWALVALVSLGGAFVALVGRATPVALALAATSVVGVTAAVALASRQSRRARYRPRTMQPADWAVAASSLLAPAGLAALAVAGDTTLAWTASPVRAPGFNPLAALALAALTVPALRVPPLASEPRAAPTPSSVAAPAGER